MRANAELHQTALTLMTSSTVFETVDSYLFYSDTSDGSVLFSSAYFAYAIAQFVVEVCQHGEVEVIVNLLFSLDWAEPEDEIIRKAQSWRDELARPNVNFNQLERSVDKFSLTVDEQLANVVSDAVVDSDSICQVLELTQLGIAACRDKSGSWSLPVGMLSLAVEWSAPIRSVAPDGSLARIAGKFDFDAFQADVSSSTREAPEGSCTLGWVSVLPCKSLQGIHLELLTLPFGSSQTSDFDGSGGFIAIPMDSSNINPAQLTLGYKANARFDFFGYAQGLAGTASENEGYGAIIRPGKLVAKHLLVVVLLDERGRPLPVSELKNVEIGGSLVLESSWLLIHTDSQTYAVSFDSSVLRGALRFELPDTPNFADGRLTANVVVRTRSGLEVEATQSWTLSVVDHWMPIAITHGV